MAKKDQNATPDRRPITELQAKHLAAISGVTVKEIVGKTIAELSDKFKWRIDPELLFFRRICGQVVKRDPVTGVELPVPFATVHVEDTDCYFLGFFPLEWPWGWFFPIFCHREEIATTVTDACGHFCVWVPRWEIDWILRFRREHICFPDIFIRPTIRDLLSELPPLPSLIRLPRPVPDLPDPPPSLLKDGGLTLRRAQELVGRDVAERLATFEVGAVAGTSTTRQQQFLDAPAFPQPIAPPLPPRFKELTEGERSKSLETLTAQFKIEPELLKGLDFAHYIGPFRRCVDVIFPEWQLFLDVPDITFRVTQDVDGDGEEETIYTENFFEVRWNSGPIPDVTLEASQIAQAGVVCDAPEVPCDNAPALQFVGRMPLVNPVGGDPYHDAVTGYARRPNRPHPSGNITPVLADFPLPLAKTPYTHVLQLYGCNHGQGAVFYRLTYSFNSGPRVPFTGLTWPLWRVVGGNLQWLWPTSDVSGWYPILPDADNWFPPHLLLDWPTNQFQDGLYSVQVELGNAGKATIATSAAICFRIDNSVPDPVQFTALSWRAAGDNQSTPISLICPVVTRSVVNGTPVDIEIEVNYRVAATHLRSVELSGGGCDGDDPILVSALSTAQHWHTNPADNSVISTAIFALPGARRQGAYSFALHAIGRAFNPAGGDGGQLADWNYDTVYNYLFPSLTIAVVDAQFA